MPEPTKLTGTERSAILILALGERKAADVLRQMEPKEVQRIGAAMTRLGSISREQINAVLAEFGAGGAKRQHAHGRRRGLPAQRHGQCAGRAESARHPGPGAGPRRRHPGQPQVDGPEGHRRRAQGRTPAGHRPGAGLHGAGAGGAGAAAAAGRPAHRHRDPHRHAGRAATGGARRGAGHSGATFLSQCRCEIGAGRRGQGGRRHRRPARSGARQRRAGGTARGRRGRSNSRSRTT